MSRFLALKPLGAEQSAAADPQVHAALSASAGTGKTQVLTARVLRLLIGGAAPESILCLTFTKAAAAEMANRISGRLAAWVQASPGRLREELEALGVEADTQTVARARQLFAQVLDAPGSLRIQTIHSFCQSLLAAFPAEAGISPGLRPIEGREEQSLARETLASLASQSDVGDGAFLNDLTIIGGRLAERDAVSYLMRCAHAPEAFAAIGDPEMLEPALRSAVNLPEGDIEHMITAGCHDDSFDCQLLRGLADAYKLWGKSSGEDKIAAAEEWLALGPEERCLGLEAFAKRIIFTKSWTTRKVDKGVIKLVPEAQDHCDELAERIEELVSLRRRAALVAVQAAGLRAGMRFAEAYTKAKRAAGVADFDDLIRWTRALLETEGMGDWVRFKLDRATHHLLVDEAQDTNGAQWAIVRAIAEEYFAGEGAGPEHRTLFMVGDFKQAIFGFQGTDPAQFEEARQHFRKLAEGGSRPFSELSISASFRSSQAVLDLVDQVIKHLGHEQIGLPEAPEPHRAFHSERAGQVELWPAFELEIADDESGDTDEEGWADDRVRGYASHIADRVKAILDRREPLASTGLPVTPGDILILVRSRTELASLIVARLFAARVPVAGIDRLHLHKPLVIKDLIAAIGFAVQPLDDLNLAALLVSPLLGWSQDDLYALAHRDARKPLWEELGRRADEQPLFRITRDRLLVLLRAADFETPAQFLERILSGPLDGRRRLMERLGRSARDPIDELVAAAQAFEGQEAASLDRFLAWFGSGEVEVKRDPDGRSNAVRIMTVHGAKGLEAPIVILADATADPDKLGPPNSPIDLVMGDAGPAPLLRPKKAENCFPFDRLIAEQNERDLQEHWRLLYVALTRAADRLIVSGLLPKSKKLPAKCWYLAVDAGMEALGAEIRDVDRVYRSGGVVVPIAPKQRTELAPPVLPAWLGEHAPAEERPPRPLAPSRLAEDRDSQPPPSPTMRAAAERGIWLHALFERLPSVAPSQRRATALSWLERSAGIVDAARREEIALAALGVIEDPAYAELFTPDGLAEAPIAATLPDGRVVAGTVDRLLVRDDVVRVVDFKTGRAVPAAEADVPTYHRTQMEAYAKALGVIFPGRRIEASLLYTSGPRLIELGG